MNYWVLEYSKVLIAYLLTMYVWPMVVFKSHLNKRSRTYRFAFCSVVSVLFYYTIIIFLGLLHILNNTLIFVLFYGVFFVQLFRGYHLSDEVTKHFRYFVTGTMKPKSYFLDVVTRIKGFFSNQFQKQVRNLRGIEGEFVLLILIVLYGVILFSYGPLTKHSFAFSDLYVHHSWLYGLRIGKIFYRGIYPEAMHCFMYLLSVVFPLRTYSIVLFLGAVHTMTILVSFYLYFRELFHWRYSPHIALILYLMVEFGYIYNAVSYARMQSSLPQEFALGGQFLIPVFLLRYLRSSRKMRLRRTKWHFYIDENLVMFIFALTETIVVHFYGTGMAFYLCVPIALVCLFRVFDPKRFVPLLCSVLIALVIAIVPMALAYAEGIPLQGSIGWGLEVIQGTAAVQGKQLLSAGVQLLESWRNTAFIGRADMLKRLMHFEISSGWFDAIGKWFDSQWPFLASVIRNAGYYTVFLNRLCEPVQIMTLFSGCLGLFSHVFLWIRNLYLKRVKKQEASVSPALMDGYLILAISGFVYIYMFIGPLIGVPELISRTRLVGVIQLLHLAMFVVPLDLAACLIQKRIPMMVNGIIGTVCACLTVILVLQNGLFHSDLYMELTRYNAAVDVTNKIIDQFPKNHFTIISTTDELYQVNEYGYHEEMLEFLWNDTEKHYTIPTPYLFIYVEKHSIARSQYHVFRAPSFLADPDKDNPYISVTGSSRDPEITYVEISEEYAAQPRPRKHTASLAADDPESRAVMNSKMQMWVDDFTELHPHDISVFYEDEDFVCYMIQQNPARLFELAIH